MDLKTPIPDSRKLDVTDCKLKGVDLIKEVENRVKDTQRLIARPYPGHLYVTEKQFVEFAKAMGVSSKVIPKIPRKRQIFKTKYNIMEIHVEGGANAERSP